MQKGNGDFCRKYHAEIIKYDMNAVARRIGINELFKQQYDKPVKTGEEGNERLKELILSGKPFMAGKFGGNEIRTIADILFEESGGHLGGLSKRQRFKITNQAGFFPDDKNEIIKFVKLFTELGVQADLLAVWNMFMQPEIAKRVTPNAEYTELRSLEPYYFSNPWTEALKNKKVLVIHPFANTIEAQYKKREELFEKDILPEFELVTLQAVQTIAGKKDERFATWFEALDYMYEESRKIDFDIALLGCGAYGFPLAAKIKECGKQAIHIGGALQILFGIKGNRWDNHEYIGKLYNDAWVRPSENEKVTGSGVVENSCYW